LRTWENNFKLMFVFLRVRLRGLESQRVGGFESGRIEEFLRYSNIILSGYF
jgi:hypothetical protein